MAAAADKIQLYCVFHEKVFAELCSGLPESERGQVCFYGVNPRIPKTLPDPTALAFAGFQWRMEWEFAHYDAWLQEKAWCQTSCMYHLYENNEWRDVDYIGFFQYDMEIAPDLFSDLREKLAASRARGCIPVFHEQTLTPVEALAGSRGWDIILESYNRTFGTKWTLADIPGHPRMQKFPIVHTFVLPKLLFHRMMAWMCPLLRAIEAAGDAGYPTNISQAEFGERIHALFIALECAAPDSRYELIPFKVAHRWPHYHNQVPWENYKCVVRE